MFVGGDSISLYYGFNAFLFSLILSAEARVSAGHATPAHVPAAAAHVPASPGVVAEAAAIAAAAAAAIAAAAAAVPARVGFVEELDVAVLHVLPVLAHGAPGVVLAGKEKELDKKESAGK